MDDHQLMEDMAKIRLLLEDRNLSEIARRTGLPADTVRNFYNTSHQSLRETVEVLRKYLIEQQKINLRGDKT